MVVCARISQKTFLLQAGVCTRVTSSWNQYCLNLWYCNASQLQLQKFRSVLILLPFLLDLLDVLNADSAATSRAEGSRLFPSWAFSRNDQRLWEGTRSSVSRGFKHIDITFTLWWPSCGLKGNFKDITSCIGQVYFIPLAIVVWFLYLWRGPVFVRTKDTVS